MKEKKSPSLPYQGFSSPNRIMGLLVPAWTLGFEKGGWRCRDCFMRVEPNSYLPGPKERMVAPFDEEVLCPVCSSFVKEPTKKMTKEEIGNKKEEIRNRIGK
jgi:hypothetical protein